MKIDLAKSALQNFLDLVDSQNPGLILDPTKVDVSNLQAYTDSNHPAVNTSVLLTAKAGSGFKDSVTVHYGRLPLATEFAAPGDSLNVSYPYPAAADILTAIASHYGYLPDQISWAQAPTPPAGTAGGTGNGTIQSQGSLVYQDGSLQVPLTYLASLTAALLHFDGNAVDATGRTWTLNGNAAVTGAAKFGGYSFVSGTGTLSTPADASLVFSDEFTIEGWAYRTSALGDTTLLSCKTANDSTHQTGITQQSNMGLGIILTDGKGPQSLGGAAAFPLNQWNHWAVCKRQGVYYGFINGVLTGQITSSLGFGLSGGTYTIGGNQYNTASQFPGRLDEIRFSRVARYTANFSVPTAPFALD